MDTVDDFGIRLAHVHLMEIDRAINPIRQLIPGSPSID
jgi:hypothetical protein